MILSAARSRRRGWGLSSIAIVSASARATNTAISSVAVWSRSGRAPRQSPQARAGNADLLHRLANISEMFRERSLDQSEIKIGATGGDHGRSTGQRPYLPNFLPNYRRSATNSARCNAASSRGRRSGVDPARGLRRAGPPARRSRKPKYAMGGPMRRGKQIFMPPHVPGDTTMPAQRLALEESAESATVGRIADRGKNSTIRRRE